MTSKFRPILPKGPITEAKYGRNAVQKRKKSKLLKHHKLFPPAKLVTSSSKDSSMSRADQRQSNLLEDSNVEKTNVLRGDATSSSKDCSYLNLSASEKQVQHTSATTSSQQNLTTDSQLCFLIDSNICENKSFKSETSSSKSEITKEKLLSVSSKVDTSPVSSGTFTVNKEFEVKRNASHVASTFCFVCNMEFGTPDLLQNHRESKQFFCRVCVVEFNKHNELECHFKSHKPFKCKTCKALFFSKKDLFQHKAANKVCNLRIECQLCKKKFYEERCLKEHNKRYHSDSKESFKCVVCQKTFNTYVVYNYHLKRIHQAYEHIQCQICSVLMVGPDRLKQHFKTTHLEAAEGDIHVCPVCKKISSTKSLLRNHMEIHDNTVRLCEICGKSVEGKQPMRRHMAKEHSKTGFTCTTCNQQFNTLNELRKHTKHHRKPVDESVYCEVCGKKLKNSHTLKIHLQIHSDDKPFKCDICGACFKQDVTLKTHQRVHSDLGKYFCNVCGMSFRWKQTFDKHVSKCGRGGHNSFDERFLNQRIQP